MFHFKIDDDTTSSLDTSSCYFFQADFTVSDCKTSPKPGFFIIIVTHYLDRILSLRFYNV